MGATSALFPLGRFAGVGRCALSVVLGYSITGAIAFGLTAIHRLSSGVFTGLLVAIGSALWIRAVWLQRSRDRSGIWAKRSDLWPLIAGAVVIAGLALVRLTISPVQNLGSATSFRYWADGLEMAAAGRIPNVSLQWGMRLAPAVSKIMLNSFDAGMSLLLHSQALPAMGALTWISATGLSLSLWWLGLELGLQRTAPLLVLWLCGNSFIGNHEFTSDLKYFRAEAFGRMVAFCALALAIRAVRDRRERTDAIVAGALFGVALSTHIVPTAVTLGMLAWYCAHLAVRHGAARAALARRLGAIVLTAGAVGTCVFLVVGGGLAFGGAGGGGKYEPINGADPTALFTTGLRAPLGSGSDHWYQAPHTLIDGYVTDTFRHSFEHSSLILLGLTLLGIALILLLPPGLKPPAVVAVGCGVNLVVVTLAFGYFYDVYALATFGARRLGDYSVLPVLILGLVLLEWAASLVPTPRLAGALVVAVVVVLGVLFLPSLKPAGPPARRTASTLSYLDWIRENTPCSARILSNRRTGGTFEVLTGRAAVTEGMGPHLRPRILNEVVLLLEKTRGFFQHPAKNANLLADQGIDYLVVYRHKPPLLNLRTFTANLQGLSKLLPLARVYSNRQVFIYRVANLTTNSSLPRPPGYPGYQCDRGAIEAAG